MRKKKKQRAQFYPEPPAGWRIIPSSDLDAPVDDGRDYTKPLFEHVSGARVYYNEDEDSTPYAVAIVYGPGEGDCCATLDEAFTLVAAWVRARQVEES